MGELDGTCEVLIVDDGSTDNTYELARAAQEMDPRFRPIRLSLNFGHQVALTAGMVRSRGAAVVTMDADRQHPADTVLEMAKHWRNGYDVAYGVMVGRPSESAFKRFTSDGFYKLINAKSDTPMPANAGDFRLLDREVVNAFLRMPERSRYIRGMISWLGFEQVGVPYTCASGHGGRSTCTPSRMIRLRWHLPSASSSRSFSTARDVSRLADQQRFLRFPLSTLTTFIVMTVGVSVLVQGVGVDPNVVSLVSALAAVPLSFVISRMLLVGHLRH